MKRVRYAVLVGVLFILVLSLVSVQDVEAKNNCKFLPYQPIATGANSIYAHGYADCGMSGQISPYLRVCVKKINANGSSKTIGCSNRDYLAGFSKTEKEVTVSCSGPGRYYTELQWINGTKDALLFALSPPATIGELGLSLLFDRFGEGQSWRSHSVRLCD